MLTLTMNQMLENLEKSSITSLKFIALEHLQSSNFKIFGYWDENDKFYDEITLKQPLDVDLANYSVGKNLPGNLEEYWIKLKFLLIPEQQILADSEKYFIADNIVGEMTLILDENFKFIDEIWSIDIDSPFVIA
ncbi:hypothetical protein [Okeania sp.]|uniref:hypothetical protein n=1 Tax=Okeania sp. TaxID=3100323 RepID=UPI002B4ACF3C|nr:hypothetical protein [Okeania sp.]MEB3343742.1 hypothetical protein [Okeania sp.]